MKSKASKASKVSRSSSSSSNSMGSKSNSLHDQTNSSSSIPSETNLFSHLNGHNTLHSPLILQFHPSSTFFSSPTTPPRLSIATAAALSATQSVSTGDDASVSTGDGASVFQLIQSHQEKAARLPPVEEIRTLLHLSFHGMLSTFSQKHEGYPSGSMVDFACDADGSPILAVSSLAVHTKDLALNPKCSLLVARNPEDRTDLVVTLHGDAIPVSEKDQAAIRTAYLAKHPNAFSVDFGDFQFMRIEPKVVRYVSGVATALLGSGEFGSEEYKAAKVDPVAQLKAYMAHANYTIAIVQYSMSIPVDSAYMLDLDSLGFNVKARYQGDNFKLRIPFPRRAEDQKDVKTLMMEMVAAAMARGCYPPSP